MHKSIVIAATLLSLAHVLATVLQLYFSPFHTCVRENGNTALLCVRGAGR